MQEIEEKATRAFSERVGEGAGDRRERPGRVNLIGDHTGYNGGFNLPYAIERLAAASKGVNELYSIYFDKANRPKP